MGRPYLLYDLDRAGREAALDDLVQETTVRLKAGVFGAYEARNDASPCTFYCGVARNVARETLRRELRRRRVEHAGVEGAAHNAFSGDEIEYCELLVAVRDGLEPDQLRLLEALVSGHQPSEVAALLGLDGGVVEHQLELLRERIATIIDA